MVGPTTASVPAPSPWSRSHGRQRPPEIPPRVCCAPGGAARPPLRRWPGASGRSQPRAPWHGGLCGRTSETTHLAVHRRAPADCARPRPGVVAAGPSRGPGEITGRMGDGWVSGRPDHGPDQPCKGLIVTVAGGPDAWTSTVAVLGEMQDVGYAHCPATVMEVIAHDLWGAQPRSRFACRVRNRLHTADCADAEPVAQPSA